MADLLFVGQFIASKAGKTGLTVTVDVDRYTLADGSRTALVTAGSATEGRRGLYHYRLASADLATYQYVATFITADATVDQQEIAALGIVVPDALVGSRLAPATAGRTLDVDASGNASANVTYWAGVAVAAADLNGNVPVIVKAWYDTLVPEPGTAGYPDVGTVSNISLQVSQQVRDAMKLAPSGGAVAAGSVDAELAALPTAAENAYAVWNENMADHLGPTSTGGRLNLAAQAGPVGDMIEAVGYNRFKTTAFENMPAAVGLATANLDAQLAGLPTAADVQAAATAALEAYDPPTMAELTSAVAPLALEATAQAVLAAVGGHKTYSYSNTVDDGSGNLLDGVFIQLATDSAFTNIINATHTNSQGAFTVYSDIPGAHYLRLQRGDMTFTDQTVTLA